MLSKMVCPCPPTFLAPPPTPPKYPTPAIKCVSGNISTTGQMFYQAICTTLGLITINTRFKNSFFIDIDMKIVVNINTTSTTPSCEGPLMAQKSLSTNVHIPPSRRQYGQKYKDKVIKIIFSKQ